MTIGELKKLIADMDDDTVVISVDSNYELRGSYTKAHVSSGFYKEVKEHFRDDFDGTPYSATVYVGANEEEGKKMLVVL